MEAVCGAFWQKAEAYPLHDPPFDDCPAQLDGLAKAQLRNNAAEIKRIACFAHNYVMLARTRNVRGDSEYNRLKKECEKAHHVYFLTKFQNDLQQIRSFVSDCEKITSYVLDVSHHTQQIRDQVSEIMGGPKIKTVLSDGQKMACLSQRAPVFLTVLNRVHSLLDFLAQLTGPMPT